jgi:hypothetical protein
MPTKKKPKLRPLIHESWSYLITKFYDSEPALVIVSVRSLQKMIQEVEEAAKVIYPDEFPVGLAYSLEEVRYVLDRLTEMDARGQIAGNKDVYVFGDAFRHRFEEFLGILDEIDAEA